MKIGLHLKLKKGIVLNFYHLRQWNVPHLEITEVVLVHCDIVNNDYQQDSRALHTFVPNKPFGSLLEISPTNQIFLKTLNFEYSEIKVWFTDQNSKPLEIEDRINLTMMIKWRL